MRLMPLIAMGMAMESEAKPGSGKASAPATPMFVDIIMKYAADGTPSADPDPAYVRKGGTITWHTDAGVDAPFEIIPKLAWVSERGPEADVLGLQSHRNNEMNWQEVKIGASLIAGTYHYGIGANGKIVDPDVVIKPN